MKKTLSLILLLAAAVTAMARPVDPQRALRLVEEHFFAPAMCVSPAEWDELYVFVPVEGEGFVIVSADDCTRPVLGYSMNSRWPVVNGQWPAHVTAWIDGYRREIGSLRKAGAIASPAVQALWMQPKVGRYEKKDPLMTTTWNQSPWYNDMCPYSFNDEAHAVTGCVATAQAQVMKYWNHPVVGHGSHTYGSSGYGPLTVDYDTAYQWDLMPDHLDWSSSEEEIHAVAQLMYHVGVSVEMSYGVASSGAHVIAYTHYGYNIPSTERSLREHFGYNPMLEGRVKEHYTDRVWDQMIRNEISHNRPVIYSGRDETGGHAFVLDGYDSLGMFHVNWGWGGWCDGYYTTDSLSPGTGGTGGNSTYTFNLQNQAIFGVRPCYGNDSLATVNLVSSDSTQGVVLGSGTYVPYEDTVTITIVPAEGYRFNGWTSGCMSPFLSFVPNGDLVDTALFARMGHDTMAYCADDYYSHWRSDYGAFTEWGIRVPPSRRNPLRSLNAVQLFVEEPGYYTMKIYCGESISPSTLVLTLQPDLTEASGWTTIDLDEPLFVPDDQPVWITFGFTTVEGHPATASIYTAVSDGCWCKRSGEWQPLDQTGVYHTWMIRALFSERPVRVSVETNLSVADMQEAGISITGAGDYPYGDTACLVVDPGIAFAWGWNPDETLPSDQENPNCFQVLADTTLYAWFHYCTGIDDVEGDAVRVTVIGRSVSVDIPEGMGIAVYDVQGRLVANRRTFTVSAAGVYLIQVDGKAAGRILIP